MSNDLFGRMLTLSAQGFQCAQIMMLLALESDGKEDPDLVRAVGGLNMGFTDSTGPCGALSGGCCFLSYYTGKGDTGELEDPAFREILAEFTSWFRAEYGQLYGGFMCNDILERNPDNIPKRCPDIIQSTYLKAVEILGDHGVEV